MGRAFGWSALIATAGVGLYFAVVHYLIAGNPHGLVRGLPPLIAAAAAMVSLRRSRRAPGEAMARALGVAASVMLIGFAVVFGAIVPAISGLGQSTIFGIFVGVLLLATALPLVAHLMSSKSPVPNSANDAPVSHGSGSQP